MVTQEHLLCCNCSPSYEDISILTKESNGFELKVMESLTVARDKPCLNPNGGISNFRISGQSIIKENCHNSRTSDDIDITWTPLTKLDKRNKATSKKLTIRHVGKL